MWKIQGKQNYLSVWNEYSRITLWLQTPKLHWGPHLRCSGHSCVEKNCFHVIRFSLVCHFSGWIKTMWLLSMGPICSGTFTSCQMSSREKCLAPDLFKVAAAMLSEFYPSHLISVTPSHCWISYLLGINFENIVLNVSKYNCMKFNSEQTQIQPFHPPLTMTF